MLRNSKIAAKAIVPLALRAIVASRLPLYANARLNAPDSQVRQIVDVDAVRLERC